MEDENLLFEERPIWLSYAAHFVISIVFMFFMGLGLLIIVWIVLDRSNKMYRVTNQRITVSKGILSKRKDEVEIKNIRNITTEQNIWQRLTNCGDILIGTSGVSGYEIVIRDVAKHEEVAALIRKQVT